MYANMLRTLLPKGQARGLIVISTHPRLTMVMEDCAQWMHNEGIEYSFSKVDRTFRVGGVTIHFEEVSMVRQRSAGRELQAVEIDNEMGGRMNLRERHWDDIDYVRARIR